MQITSLLIGGNEWLPSAQIAGTEIVKDTGGRFATCNLDVLSGGNAVVGMAQVGSAKVGRTIKPRAEVIVASAGPVRQFAGYVSRYDPARITPTQPAIRLTCQDYTTLLETAVIQSAVFTSQTDEQIIDSIFAAYLPEIDTSLVVSVATIGSLELRDVTLRQAMEKIVERTGADWYIDFDGKLRYFSPGANPAAFGLSENPDSIATYPLLREGFSYSEEFSTPANEVTVLGVAGTSTNTQVSLNGASGDDGYTNKFAASFPPDAGTPATDTAATGAIVQRSKIGSNYWVSIGMLRFDTSSIPDTATILAATLKLATISISNANSGEVGIEYYATGNWPVETGDYTSTPANNAFAYYSLSSLPFSGFKSYVLLSPDSNINKTGFTGFRVHVRTASTPTGDNEYRFETQEGANKPVLEIIYQTGTPDITGFDDDSASQALYGVLKRTIIDRAILTEDEADLRAQIEVAQFAYPQKSGTAVTRQDGLGPGEMMLIDAPSLGISAEFLIRRLAMHWVDQNTVEYRLDYGDYRPDLIRLLRLVAN